MAFFHFWGCLMPETIAVFKTIHEPKRIVWSELYSPGKLDSDHEFMRAEQIEAMAYDFMKTMKLDAVDHQHDQQHRDGCCVVESFIARKGDPDFIEGAWVIGMYVGDDEMWDKVVKGEINGFSMEAMVVKEPKQVTMEVAPVLTGLTQKSEGHEHTFLVAYDNQGNFLGGKTDQVNGHSHAIRYGTATTETNGHSHRFSHIEQLNIN